MKNATIFIGRNSSNTQVIFIALGSKKRYENPAKYHDSFRVDKIESILNQYEGLKLEDLTKEPQQIMRGADGWFIC